MILRLSWSYLLAVAFAAAAGDSCRQLQIGDTVSETVSGRRSACFLAPENAPGSSVQISVTQPVDLMLEASAPGATAIIVDTFDFGDESVTLPNSPQWRIVVSAVEDKEKSVRVDVTARSVPATEVPLRRNAESAATTAKKTMHPTDISKALELWRQLTDTPGVSRSYLRLGTAALRSGDAAAARDAYEEARRICQGHSDLRCSAEAANNSGLAERRLGDVEQARVRLDEAAEGWRKLNHQEGAAITLSNLGLLYSQTGDWQAAITAYDRARRILRDRNRVAHARVLNNLGLCYLSLAEYPKAQAYFLAALQSLPAGTRDAIRARVNLGRTHMMRGSLSSARVHLQRAVKEAGGSADRATLADARNNLGQLLLKRQQPAAALEELNEALSIYDDIHDRRGRASTLHYLGLASQQVGKLDQARSFLREALRIRSGIGLQDDAAASSLAIAELEMVAGDLATAREYADQALTTIESVRAEVPGPALRASYYAGVRRVFDVTLEIIMRSRQSGATEEGLLTAERGRARALLDAVTERVRSRDVPPSLTARRTGVQRRLNWMSRRLAEASDDEEAGLRRQIELILAESEEVEAQIREVTSSGAVSHEIPTFGRLAAAVPEGSALLEYHLGPRRSYLWLLHSGRLSAFQIPSAGAIRTEAQAVVRLFGDILERRRSVQKQRAFEQAINRLSKMLLGPLAGVQLPERLLITADGVLHSVPLAALTIPGTRRPLGLAHDLLRIPAATYLLTGRSPRPVDEFPMTVLAVADPVFSAGDPRLSSARRRTAPGLPRLAFTDELRSLTALVPPGRRRVLRGFDATPAALEAAHLQKYAILHLSTHAIVDHEIPEMSRIALTLVDRQGRPVDGFLRPYELAQWQLDASLVVLAACETAQGKQVIGEGVVGLASSLLYAGASQLIATVARIDDEASAKFLQHTYRHLLSADRPSATRAVMIARRAIAGSPRWSDPYYWASFVVIGRPVP